MIMLTVTIHGACESAHAVQGYETARIEQISHAEVSTPHHHCPCAPQEQHNDYDGCDACVNCSCHASLTVHPFQLNYNPLIADLNTHDPFRSLPEVYLTKFIPPQICA